MSQAGILNISGGGGGGSPIETITGNDGVATSPIANNIDLVGLTVANATNDIPVYVKHTATSTDSIEVQVAGAAASSAIDNAGLASFNSADFTVDDNGYVSAIDTGIIQTINGDTGSISGATVKIYANQASINCGASVKFVNSGIVSTLYVSDETLNNTYLGYNCGKIGLGGSNTCVGWDIFSSITSNFAEFNTGMGYQAFGALTTGSNNVGIGASSLQALTTGTGNTAIGRQAGYSFNGAASYNTCLGSSTGFGSAQTGSYNVLIGYEAGIDNSLADSSNIYIMNSGVTGDSNIMRLGTQGSGNGQVEECFIAGITDTTPTSGNTPQVVLCDNTGNMTVISSQSSGYVLTSNGTATPSFQPAGGGGGSATAFYAYCSSSKSNVTGNSVIYKVVFDSTVRNDSSAYNTSTGVFTAPKTGFYCFNTIIGFGSGSSFSAGSELVVSSFGSVYSQILSLESQNIAAQTDSEVILSNNWTVPMTAGDTMAIQVLSTTTLQDVSINGSALSSNAFTAYSSFSGFFVGT